MNNNNFNKSMMNNNRRVGEQDLNPLPGFQPLQGNAPSSMSIGFGGNLVGPNNPIFNGSNIPSASSMGGGMKPQMLPGSRFDPVYPIIGPFGGSVSGNRGESSSSSSFGNINPDHHKPPQFGDEDL
ncbi:predicted protein [Naegleria gruberi]|uniref:Predicted protein n=1 Tax=Naegleria gruberi TaxID=5762 RepID=D2V976_NAEGR|nr:uncharacterized protein NAEGRDRAFT_47784 [Naegleria gruberi]EFC46541.1 predicted protein [Naegleria gruberi]|eukprot:XP_002679285.1 predicted protein [Naegleria gruberi strain NEG-M]